MMLPCTYRRPNDRISRVFQPNVSVACCLRLLCMACARQPYLSILNTSIELQVEFVVFNFRGPFLLLFPFSVACIFLICLYRVTGRVLEESGGIAWYFH
jgi:hypothetical protein